MLARVRPTFGSFMVAAALVAAACGSGGSATAAPTAAPTVAPTAAGGGQPTSAPGGGGGGAGAVDAGSILTPEMAGSIIGGTVTKVPIPSTAGMSLVAYTNESGDNVTVLVQPVPAGTGAAMMSVAIQAAGAEGNLQTFTGLGDAAGKVVNENDATVVFVKGDALVVVHAESATSSGSDIESKLESVARQIAGTL